MFQKNKITIYTPESGMLNPWKMLKDICQGALAGKELAYQLLRRNISSKYRQTILGVTWAFLTPVMTMLVWVFLKNSKIFPIGNTGLPYPVYVLVGTVLWQLFTQSIETPLQVVKESKQMLIKINFPHEALLMVSFGQIVFDFLIKALVLVPLFWWFSITPSLTFFLALAGILLIILLGMSIGILLTPFGMLFGDFQRIVSVFLGFLFFLTPIVYPMPKEGVAGFLAKYNPISPILQATRNWMTGGNIEIPTGFWFGICGVAVLLTAGLALFKVAIPHIIERSGS